MMMNTVFRWCPGVGCVVLVVVDPVVIIVVLVLLEQPAHLDASCLIAQRVRPRELVRQQVTASARPQTLRSAHRWTTDAQLLLSSPASTRSRVMCAAHRVYS